MTSLSAAAVADALQAFINTDTPRDAIAAFRRSSDALLSDEALALLDSNLARFHDDPEAQAIFGLRKQAMVAAREHGVEAGVAQLYVPDPTLQQIVLAFVNADYPDKVRQLRRTAALLAPDTIECLDMLALRYAGHPEGANPINLARELVARANRDSVDAARRWLLDEVLRAVQNGQATGDALISGWETALALTEGESERTTRAQIQVNLAQAYRARQKPGDPDCAIAVLEQALEVLTRDTFPKDFSGIHRVLGNIFFGDEQRASDERYARAIDHYLLALEGLSAKADPHNFLHVNFMIGSCWQALHQPDRARPYLHDGLTAVDLADLGEAIAVCESMADVLNGGGAETAAALHEALSRLTARIEQLSTDTDPAERAGRAFGLANVYRESNGPWRSDDLERAIALTEVAARIWTRATEPDMWARTQHNLGAAYTMRREGDHADNIEQAIQYYEHALTVHTREAFPTYWALTHNALGTAWLEHRKGNLDDNAETAARIFDSALTIWDLDSDPLHWGECYNGLGAANLRLVGRYGRPALDRAIECFERATNAHTRERFRSRWSQLLNNLAKAYLERTDPGDPERALDLLRQAIEVTDRGGESYLWATFKKNEAAAHSQITGDENHAHADAAIAGLREALSVFDAERYPSEHRDTQSAVGELWFRRSAWGDALAAYREAIRAAERVFDRAYTEIGRLTEAGELSAIYRNAAFCLVQLGQAHEALETYDRGKTRVLIDAIELSRTKFDGLPPAHREEAAKARDAIAAAESQMRLPQATPGRPTDADLGRSIAEARERLARAIGKSAQTHDTLTDLLRVIPDAGALVIPMLTSRGGIAFVVPHGVNAVTNAHVVPASIDIDGANALLIGSEDQPGLLRTYVEYLNERADGSREDRRRAFNRYQRKLQEVCGQLWPALMQPIVERLKSLALKARAPVLIVPHGALALMPLHAASSGRGHNVLQRFDVQYSPSLAVQAQTRARLAVPRRTAQLLAIADPTGDLTFADVECGELARLVGGDRATVLGGASATHDAVVAAVSSPTYLHFSCHGFYDWRDPLRSGLILADGVLDVAEIMSPRIDLDATRAVVLSACETGLFDFNRYPDEFVGLNSGLLMAGAPAVVSTLWAVEDRSTALLMSEFYRRVLDGDSISSSLGNAQLWLSMLTFSALRTWVVEHASFYADEAKRRPMFEPIARAVSDWATELATMNDIDADARPYEHPYYWAAFMALGAV